MDRSEIEAQIEAKLSVVNRGAVRFEYQYQPLRVAYFFVAKGEIRGRRMAHYGYLDSDEFEGISDWIDAIALEFFSPKRLQLVDLDTKPLGWLLEDCEHVIATEDGFKTVRPAREPED